MNGETVYDRPGANSTQAEPGAIENRLSLNPNDPKWSDEVGEWRDDEVYSITLRVRQISPGEFEVMEASGSAAPAANEQGGADEAPQAGDDEGPAPEGVNPAVAKMMRSKKSY